MKLDKWEQMLSWGDYLPLLRHKSAINVPISIGMLSSSCNLNIHWIKRESNKPKDTFSFSALEKHNIHCEDRSLQKETFVMSTQSHKKKNKSSANHKAYI